MIKCASKYKYAQSQIKSAKLWEAQLLTLNSAGVNMYRKIMVVGIITFLSSCPPSYRKLIRKKMTLYSKFKLAMIKINTKKPTIKLTPSKHFVFNLLGFPFLLFISFLCNENITWNKCDRIISKFCWYTEYLVLIWPWVIPFCSNLAGLTDIRVLPPGRNDVPSNNCTAKATDGSWIVERERHVKINA